MLYETQKNLNPSCFVVLDACNLLSVCSVIPYLLTRCQNDFNCIVRYIC